MNADGSRHYYHQVKYPIENDFILDVNVLKNTALTKCRLVQSVGPVEYTDCMSKEGQDFPNECPAYETKQSVVRFQQCWIFHSDWSNST